MAHIQHSSIVLTETEAEYYNQELDKAKSITRILELMRECYDSVGITLEIHWNPSFTYFTRWNKVIPAFKGPISGKNVNQSGKQDPRVYSMSVTTTKNLSSFDKFFRIETAGSGGGGDNWRYDYGYIDIRDFPAMLAEYTAEVDVAIVRQKKHDLQLKFDQEIQTIQNSLLSIVTNVKYSKPIRDIEKTQTRLNTLVKVLEQLKKDTTQNLIHTAVEEANITIPQASSPFINLSKYNKLVNTIQSKPFVGAKFTAVKSEIDSLYSEFQQAHPELFI